MQVPKEIIEQAGGNEKRIAELLGAAPEDQGPIAADELDFVLADDLFCRGIRLSRLATRPITMGVLVGLEKLDLPEEDVLPALLYLITEQDLGELQRAMKSGAVLERGQMLMYEMTVSDSKLLMSYANRVFQVLAQSGGDDASPFGHALKPTSPTSTDSPAPTNGQQTTFIGSSPTQLE